MDQVERKSIIKGEIILAWAVMKFTMDTTTDTHTPTPTAITNLADAGGRW
jgi:hypothetical protein